VKLSKAHFHAKRLIVVRLPAYAPELNTVAWVNIEGQVLANRCYDELRGMVEGCMMDSLEFLFSSMQVFSFV
jgi:hypothetical protein